MHEGEGVWRRWLIVSLPVFCDICPTSVCKTRRGELKNQLPELAFGKIGAKLGEIWRNMTQVRRQGRTGECRRTLNFTGVSHFAYSFCLFV